MEYTVVTQQHIRRSTWARGHGYNSSELDRSKYEYVSPLGSLIGRFENSKFTFLFVDGGEAAQMQWTNELLFKLLIRRPRPYQGGYNFRKLTERLVDHFCNCDQ